MFKRFKRIRWETKLTIALLLAIVLVGSLACTALAGWSNLQPAISANDGSEFIVCRMPDIAGATLCAPIDTKQITNCWYFKPRGIIECEPGI